MIDNQKKEIRIRIHQEKKRFTLKQKKKKSEKIFEKLENLQIFENSEIVMAYWSMDDEVATHEFVQKYSKKKKIILPVVNGDKLVLKEFSGINNMKTGESYGIGEPTGELFNDIEKIDLIIIPGVAFDKSGNRLGRGKAYYDKLLKTSSAHKIGVCFDFQLIENIPTEEHDERMDLVITDK